MAAEDRRCCGDPFTVAPRLRRRSRTSVSRLLGAGREARSGAITRQGSARQPFWAAWPRPLHALQSSVGTRSPPPCSSNLVRLNPTVQRNNACSGRTALLEHGSAGMSFSRFQAWLKPCLGSLKQGTGLQCLWTLWRARIQRPNRTLNRTPNAEPEMRRT